MELGDLLKSSLFWIASTTLAILISIIGNILTPKVLKLFARFSKGIRQRRTTKEKVVSQFVTYIAADVQRIINTKIDVLHQLLWSVLLQLIAFSALVSDFWFSILSGIVLTAYNVYFMSESSRLYSYARRAAEQNKTLGQKNVRVPEHEENSPELK